MATSARISETVAGSFRVDGEALRDLDAVVRDRTRDFMSEPVLVYQVVRRDALTYNTDSVEDVLRERNGSETAIRSVSLRVEHGENLQLQIAFTAVGVQLQAEATDRAKLTLLASDFRSLVRDRMMGRGSTDRRRLARSVLPLILAVLAAITYSFMLDRDGDHRSEQYDRALASIRQTQAATRFQLIDELSRARVEVDELAGAPDRDDDKLDLIMRLEVRTRQFELNPTADEYPDYPDAPWYYDAPYLIIVPTVAALLGYAAVSLAIPRSEHRFMIGDEIVRQAKRDKVRDRVFWTILVGFLVSVAASAFMLLF